jgi:hypothetical protein
MIRTGDSWKQKPVAMIALALPFLQQNRLINCQPAKPVLHIRGIV